MVAPEKSTTPDLAQRVRTLLEVGDRADWDLAMEFFAPDAVWVTIDFGAHTGTAIRDFWADWYAPYEDVRIEILEIVNLGGGVVVAVIRQSGRLGDAPSRLREDTALVYEWSNGLIQRVTTYGDLREARAAAERLAAERRSHI